MKYFQNHVQGMEGLCNQLMALYRAVSEAFLCIERGESACIILADGQTRNFINLTDEPFFSPLSIDAFIEVDQFQSVLASRSVSLLRLRDAESLSEHAVRCSRFPISTLTPEEAHNTGIWIAASLPFAAKPLELAHTIIGSMSHYPKWAAMQLRIEGDILYGQEAMNISLDNYAQQYVHLAAGHLAQFPAMSAVYIATGVKEEVLRRASKELTERFPDTVLLSKKEILRRSSGLWEEFQALSLEEQALVDWLVCLNAPHFLGPHGNSFSYLAGYMRHYRGLEPDTTLLWPEYQPYWDLWFPRV
ncbi:hypothetical protein MKY96_05915 [Paenibacillus sp. FSL R7-0302]|uniref:hypothetical protein n=1 Tax=Paenibacillus sp. FSL R7-0302 TaxID=2921681 RepID=UPI0030F57F86